MSNFVLTPNAVAKLRRAIAPRSGNTGAAAASGRPIDPDKFPPPFTVRWSASANDSAGAWLIWLPSEGESPSPDKLVIYDGEGVTIDGVTAADNLPAGWYTIDDADGQSEEVYLVITVTDSTGAAEAELSETEGQATTGETVYNVKVAAMATDAETGARSVKQYVDSVVTFGGGGDAVTPDDVSTEFIPEPEEGEEPTGDEGELQIKGFKSGQPADANTLPDYLQGTAAIPSGGISLVCRSVDTNGNRHLFYLPLAAMWGDGTSGGLPLPEVTYLDDITWDATNHQLVKHWVKKNIVTGAETPVQGAPQGKTATINTTPISSIIPQSS